MNSAKTLGLTLAAMCCYGAADDPANQLQIRLTTAITSYSPPGTAFQARVIGPVLPAEAALPSGTIIRGVIRKVHPVGIGIRRERALLELEFQNCESPAGANLDCRVDLIAVDNGRETVGARNSIKGILAASYPHGWFNGFWYRPAPGLAGRAAVGLTGAAGTIQSKLAPTILGAGVILASRLLLLRMPEPEIELPPGTEMIVRVSRSEQAEQPAPFPAVLRVNERLSRLPAQVTRPDRTPAKDLLHLAFAGTEDQVAAAFGAAGWSPADPRTAGSFARSYTAFATMTRYPTAPVSQLFYQGRPPALVFQKSFNSISKRHHIRIWKDEEAARPMFVAAATHDVGISLRWRRLQAVHEIDPLIDRERTKIVNDLADAGCVAALEIIERPGIARTRLEKGAVITDGRLYLVRLRECSPKDVVSPSLFARRGLLTIGTRRLVLETRHYFTRASVFYLGFRGLHLAYRWRRPVIGSAQATTSPEAARKGLEKETKPAPRHSKAIL
jgi:hypothetical protein